MSLLPRLVSGGARSMVLFQQSRSMAGMKGYWNRDWMPSTKLPQTEEEKKAAAKKYGLIPDDYEPYPDDGFGYGDYPKLPMIAAESRDPYALYDNPEYKRNFGEPMHVDVDMIGEDRWNYNQRLPMNIYAMLAVYVGFMSTCALLYWIGEEVRFAPVKMMPKHMLYDGKKHYSFDMEDVQ